MVWGIALKFNITIKKHLTIIFGIFSLVIIILVALILNFAVDNSFHNYAYSKNQLQSIDKPSLANDNLVGKKQVNNNPKGWSFSNARAQNYQLTNVEQELKDSINKSIVIIGLFSFLFSLLVGHLISIKLSKPLKLLTKMTQEVEKGNYDIKIEHKTSVKEISVLSSALLKMANQISESIKHDKRLSQDVQHEIRTPLTNIKAQLEAMIDGIWDIDEKNIKLCLEEVTRLNAIVNQLYQLGNLENNADSLQITNIQLNPLVKSVVDGFRIDSLEKKIKVVNLVEEKFKLKSDERLIYSSIFNLISNALRYSGKGSTIKVYTDKYSANDKTSPYYNKIKNKGDISKSYSIICIEDDGSGISQDKLDFIFERFYRVDESRSRKIGGAGLGLSIVSASIIKLGGFVDAESTINTKTVFYLYIEER